MGRFGKYKSRVVVYKPMNAHKHKIDLKTNHVKKIWVKKSDLNCCVASTSLKTVFTNFYHFARGCSRHFTGEREFLKGVSKNDEVVCLTKKKENQLQKITVATSLATKTDKKSEIELSVPIASATETEMDRKIRDNLN